MPDTTNEDALSGFMGLTVVLARLKETMPIPMIIAPTIATRIATDCRPGNITVNAGAARLASHMSPPIRNPTASGGIFNSRARIYNFLFLVGQQIDGQPTEQTS